jgi:hypothetical protein
MTARSESAARSGRRLGLKSSTYRNRRELKLMNEVRGPARAIFAAVLLMIGGVLNVIYGLAAIGNSHFFVHDTHYVFGSLKGWGWVTLILGILELVAALSLFRGGAFGRYFAIAIGALVAINSLLEIPAYPFWSIAMFGLTLWIIHGLTVSYDDGWGEAGASAPPTMASQGPRPPM